MVKIFHIIPLPFYLSYIVYTFSYIYHYLSIYLLFFVLQNLARLQKITCTLTSISLSFIGLLSHFPALLYHIQLSLSLFSFFSFLTFPNIHLSLTSCLLFLLLVFLSFHGILPLFLIILSSNISLFFTLFCLSLSSSFFFSLSIFRPLSLPLCEHFKMTHPFHIFESQTNV